MTQNSNQSVRNAEAAENSNRIPTFDEVYAMPYVRESIESVLDQNVRQYPILAGYKDDLRQEILIHLNSQLPKFNPEKSAFNTFFRTALHSAICNARKEYFRETHLSLYFAECMDDLENADVENNSLSLESRNAYARFSKNNVILEMRKTDFESVIASCPEPLRSIAKKMLDGDSIRVIERTMGIPHATFARSYLLPLRRILAEKDF
jgi:DNA-directed RNA polymerase specialized sigma24 family protein